MAIPWYAYAGFAALTSGVLAILEKRVLKREHALAFSATLAVVNVAVLTPFSLFVDFSGITLGMLGMMYGISIMASFAFFFVMRATRHLEVSTVSPLLALGPGIATLLAFGILGETVSLMNVGGIVVLIAGVIVLEYATRERVERMSTSLWRSPYARLIFYAFLLYGFSGIADRFLLGYRGVDPFVYIFIMHLFLAINFLFALVVSGRGMSDIRHVIIDARWFIFLIAIVTLASRFSQTISVSIAPLGLVVAIKHASVFVSTALGGELFHEHNLAHKMVACIVIFVGILLVVL